MGKLGKTLYDMVNSDDRRLLLKISQIQKETLFKKILLIENELGFNTQLLPFQTYYNKLKLEKIHRNGTLWLWLTINPNPKIPLHGFTQKVQNFVKRSLFSNYTYVYEQRGTTTATMGQGFHSHLLLQRNPNYPPSKVIKYSMNTFKSICNVKNFQIFNYHWLKPPMLKDKLRYILDQKVVLKQDKQSYDKLWRKENNIQKYYSFYG